MTLDWTALRNGMAVAAVAVVPGAIGGAITESAGFTLLVIAGLVVGATVAARRQRQHAPLTHGIATALGLFVVVQVFGVVRRTLAGDDITWSRIFSSAVLSLIAGVIGGYAGSRRPAGS